MEIGVPSRFACLKIEDESLSASQHSKPKESKKKSKKPPVVEPPKATNAKKADKSSAATKKKEQKASEPKEAAGGVSKKTKKKQTEQFEEWKQRDDKLGNGLYEEDLRNAILMSKLDLEQVTISRVENPKPEAKKNNKKNKTIPLDKFLNADKPSNDRASSTNCVINLKQSDFFNLIDSETKAELKKDQLNTKRKNREANINEVISLVQYQYEEERQLRLDIEQQLKTVKAELAAADLKIKSFCKILNQSQMKDKAAILVENHQLCVDKNDLTETVQSLHTLLEKERTKVASLTASLHNNKKQKEKKRKGH